MPSGYVTVTGTSKTPDAFPLGTVVGSSIVTTTLPPSLGKSGTLTFSLTSSGVVGVPYGFVISPAVGSYLSFCGCGFTVTLTVT